MSDKPRIIVISDDTDDEFDWLSDGWYTRGQRGTEIADALFRKAKRAIGRGKNVVDTIAQLEKVGFEVTRVAASDVPETEEQ